MVIMQKLNEKPIIHSESNTRIFRPYEFKQFLDAIKKPFQKERVEFLLYTGCRYQEGIEVHKKTNRINGKTLQVRNMKAMVKEKYRYVQLNNNGIRSVDYYFRHNKSLPHYVTFHENMNRWFKSSGLIPGGEIGSKCLRKSWESWLVNIYPEQIAKVFMSMGHVETTALKHYLSFPFSDNDKKDMLYYADGW